MANPEEHAKAAYGRGSVYAHEALQEAREHGKKERRITALEASVKHLQSEVSQMQEVMGTKIDAVEAWIGVIRREQRNTEPPYDPAGWREYIKEFSPLLYGERPWEEVLVALGTLYGEYACSDIDQMKKSLARIVAICEYKTKTTFLITRRPPEKLYFFSPFTLYTLFTPEGTEEEANRPGLWNYLDVGERAAEWLGSLYA
jgi:hypothetical protein